MAALIEVGRISGFFVSLMMPHEAAAFGLYANVVLLRIEASAFMASVTAASDRSFGGGCFTKGWRDFQILSVSDDASPPFAQGSSGLPTLALPRM